MKEKGSILENVYHVDVKFTNGKERHITFYNADQAKEAVKYYESKYGNKCTVTYYPEYL